MSYKLSVEECDKLLGHCWGSGINTFTMTAKSNQDDYEEAVNRCPHCGLRKMRRVVTTYRFEGAIQ